MRAVKDCASSIFLSPSRNFDYSEYLFVFFRVTFWIYILMSFEVSSHQASKCSRIDELKLIEGIFSTKDNYRFTIGSSASFRVPMDFLRCLGLHQFLVAFARGSLIGWDIDAKFKALNAALMKVSAALSERSANAKIDFPIFSESKMCGAVYFTEDPVVLHADFPSILAACFTGPSSTRKPIVTVSPMNLNFRQTDPSWAQVKSKEKWPGLGGLIIWRPERKI